MRHDTLKAVLHSDISVRIIEALMLEEGLDPDAAFRAARLERKDHGGLSHVITGIQELRFQEELVRQSGFRPDLWVRLGLRYSVASYGALGLAMMTAPSIRHWTAIPVLGNFTYTLTRVLPIEIDGHLIGMEIDTSETPEPMRGFATFRALGATTALFDDLWGKRFPFSLICTRCERPDAEVEGLIGNRIQFASDRTAFYWPSYVSDAPLAHADTLLHKAFVGQLNRELGRLVQADTFVQEVRGIIQRLEDKAMPISKAAQALGMTPRTLQRRLEERGLSYRTLVDQTKRRRAIQMVTSTDLPISQVAWKTGYADLASFDHAFRRWTGHTPSAFRSGSVTDHAQSE